MPSGGAAGPHPSSSSFLIAGSLDGAREAHKREQGSVSHSLVSLLPQSQWQPDIYGGGRLCLPKKGMLKNRAVAAEPLFLLFFLLGESRESK